MARATHAIIMAAGRGERLTPITDTTPKPLVPVLGKRMIDTIIEALRENGITDICVVVGYRKERFASLPGEYPGLSLLENPDWATANNIASLYYARGLLGNCVILDGDQLIRDPSILHPEFEASCYCCRPAEGPTREWLLTVEDGVVTSCSREGGDRGWELCSVSFWTEADGEKLRQHLEREYAVLGNRQLYWDDVALNCHPEDFRLTVRPISRQALTEIDDLWELSAADPSYLSS